MCLFFDEGFGIEQEVIKDVAIVVNGFYDIGDVNGFLMLDLFQPIQFLAFDLYILNQFYVARILPVLQEDYAHLFRFEYVDLEVSQHVLNHNQTAIIQKVWAKHH